MSKKSFFVILSIFAILLIGSMVSCDVGLTNNESAVFSNSDIPNAPANVPEANTDPSLDLISLDIDLLPPPSTKAIAAAAPKDLLILMYHHIVKGTPADEYQRSSTDFENDLKYLKNKGFIVVSLDDILSMQNGTMSVPTGRIAAITFDDGYEDLYSVAFPLLKKYDMKATSFVITSLVGSDPAWYLTWAKIKNMAAYRDASGTRLISINSHTLTHPFLASSAANYTVRNQYLNFLKRELNQSKAAIERNVPAANRGAMFLSLPYGDGAGNTDIIKTATALGYQGIRTSVDSAYNIFSGANFEIPSLAILDTTPISWVPFYYDYP